MASGFPGSIDSFTNPLSNSALNSPSHAGQHQDLNDAVNKIETYMGLVKVIPTSVANGTVSASGTIAATSGVASLSVNGAFTSGYANYLVQFVMVLSASAELRIRFRSSGTDETTSHYGAITRIQPNSATVTVTQNNGGAYYLIADNSISADIRGRVEIYSPQLTTTTYSSHQASGAGATMYAYTGGDYHTQAVAYDGFTIYPSTGTITSATIRVYGYRN